MDTYNLFYDKASSASYRDKTADRRIHCDTFCKSAWTRTDWDLGGGEILKAGVSSAVGKM